MRIACPNYDSSFEEHYLIEFGKPLYGNREEFKEFLIQNGRALRMLEDIYFVNCEQVKETVLSLGNFLIEDLNADCPLKGINLVVTKKGI